MGKLTDTEGNCHFCQHYYEVAPVDAGEDHCTLPDGEDRECQVMFGPQDMICPKFERGRPQGITRQKPEDYDYNKFYYGETEVQVLG